MQTQFLQGRIPYRQQGGGAKQTLLICHGFGSSQQSPTVEALHEAGKTWGVDTVSLDFPAHGESHDAGDKLRLAQCLSDLHAVEQMILTQNPQTELLYFGSSFGGYVTLLHLASGNARGKKACLRSAAIDMAGILRGFFSAEGGFFWDERGICDLSQTYERDFFITKAFAEDLTENSLFDLYPIDPAPALAMVHGACDSTAPLHDAEAFARLSGASLTVIPNAEHRLMGAGELEQVLAVLRVFL